ncbi:hypothetical protein HYV87_05900 [Candidatus Woesearchaeota archaeon]|nr:hypothetical protein [Candidatus Woesearchaeota archaeon]
MGGDLPSNVQGLLGCWSWVETINSQVCLLMEHAKDENGYFIAHELGHLLHHSIRPDLFYSDDFNNTSDDAELRRTNLTEMIAHAAGLLFAPFANKVVDSVKNLESIYLERNLLDEPLLTPYSFSPEEDYRSGKTHRGGYTAAEFVLSKGANIRKFVEMDVSEAEKELEKLGYSTGLFIEPEKPEQTVEPEQISEEDEIAISDLLRIIPD